MKTIFTNLMLHGKDFVSCNAFKLICMFIIVVLTLLILFSVTRGGMIKW